MEVGVIQYEARLQRLLTRFLDPHFEVRTDSYLNVLLGHLSGNNNKELPNSLIQLSLFPDWIFRSITHWESTNTRPSSTCTVFILHLASLLSQQESNFIKFNTHNVYLRLFNIIQVRKQNSTPSVKLAYIKLLSSFLEHEAGIQWLIATDNWQDALAYCIGNQTVYIAREGHIFMQQLLTKTVPYNEIFCSIIVERIVLPLRDVHCQNGRQLLEINGEQLQKTVLPTLQLVTYILENELQSPSYTKRDYRIPALFINGCHLEQTTWNIVLLCQQQELLFVLHRLMFLSHFFSLSINSKEEIFKCEDLHHTLGNVCKLLKMNFDKCYILNTLKLCHYAYHYWFLMQSRIPKPITENPVIFENQLIVIQASPLYVIAYKYCEIIDCEADNEFFRENFVYRVLKVLCEETIRMLYKWRAVLVSEKEKNLFDVAQKSIIYIMMTRKYYNRDRAVIIFTLFLYTLKDIVNIIKLKPHKSEIFNKQVGFMTSILDALASLVNDFDISWRESVETICVLGLSLDFIGLNCWPSKLVVQALKLANLSIARFMSPNLALLVDRTNDSSMSLLVPMLTAKLYDMDWDVRDSALEILQTISSIAHSKFPSFQTMLLDSGLLPIIVSMATSDSESFVRASAIKCLTQMIKVPAFWNQVLQSERIPQKMIDVIHNETEAIVRSEAASLMCRIYEHQSFQQEIMDDVHRAMMHATVTDLHWEVKVKALCFWDKSISNRLQDQGMIDGSFPNVTFSKENRKIVTLTDNEIQNRLNKVLADLSQCGCLAALACAMEDDSDMKVSEKAVRITNKLKDLLVRHNVTSTIPVPTFASPKVARNTPVITNGEISSINSDEVINDIVNFRDASLLVNVCNPSDDPVRSNGTSVEVKIVKPAEFLAFIQKDLDAMIESRREWLNSVDNLGSLLDDMLQSYEFDDVNAMDCY